jgi:membrane AbrB-like protein
MAVGGLAAALLFRALHVPLAWVLGPMCLTVLLKLRYPAAVFFPRWLRDLFLLPLGYSIGVHVTAEACQNIVSQFAGILLGTVVSILFSVLLALWTSRATGVSHASSVIGNMPGGLTPMILICEHIPSADIGVVAVLQSVRLMLAIAVVPLILVYGGLGAVQGGELPIVTVAADFPLAVWQLALLTLAGALLFWRLRAPAAFLMGPIAVIGALSVYLARPMPEAPAWLLNIAQVTTGLYLGTYIDPFQLSRNRRLFPVCIIGAMLIVLGCLLVGYFLSRWFGFSLATAFLATAPGGVAEMSITGMILGENVPIILSYQLFRLLVLNMLMPFGLAWFFNRKQSA